MSDRFSNKSFVSVIVPCRNETRFIRRCLDSLISQDYPKEQIEILVIDGMSEDGTRDIVKEYSERYSFVKVIDNPEKIVPTAMNLGIQSANGDIIIRMDAHARYEKDYISKCVKYLTESDADNVGGIWVTLPGRERHLVAESIALALSHPFGIGNAHYRTGSKEPKYVDTVPFGCYKREVFEKIGLFDEDLVRNQDDEFNLRLIKNGGKILLVPDIVSYYYSRDSLSKVWKMFFQYGYFKPLVALKVSGVLTWRQVVPALLVGSLLGSLLLSFIFKPFFWMFLSIFSLYGIVNLGISFHIVMKKGWKIFFMLPIVFSTVHFSYGIGYLKGIFDFILFKKHKKKKIQDVPLTR